MALHSEGVAVLVLLQKAEAAIKGVLQKRCSNSLEYLTCIFVGSIHGLIPKNVIG